MGRVVFAGTERTPMAPTWTFKNESSEQIPPYGVMRVTGFDVTTDPEYPRLLVNKPNTYGAQYSHAINGDLCVEAGQIGECTLGGISAAKYDDGDGLPVFNQMWGPRDATWKLKKNTPGFRVLAIANLTRKLVLVQREPFLRFSGKTNGTIGNKTLGTASIYYRNGSSSAPYYTDTTVDTPSLSVLNNLDGDLDADTDIECVWDPLNDGTEQWKIVQADCPA